MTKLRSDSFFVQATVDCRVFVPEKFFSVFNRVSKRGTQIYESGFRKLFIRVEHHRKSPNVRENQRIGNSEICDISHTSRYSRQRGLLLRDFELG